MKRIIVITGATGGIGQMLVSGLMNENTHIACIDVNQKALNEMQDEYGSKISCYAISMLDSQSVDKASLEIISQHKHIDIWINNVGVNNHNAIGPTWEIENQNWCTEVSLNLFTAFTGSHSAINRMKNQKTGHIINFGGGGVGIPKPFGSSYGAAKAGVVKFTEALDIELKKEGLNIKAFAITPGFIRNERTETLIKSDVAKKYMPKLEEVMNHGKMSDIKDTLFLIETIASGEIDNFSGKYFFATAFKENLKKIKEGTYADDFNLLRLVKIQK